MMAAEVEEASANVEEAAADAEEAAAEEAVSWAAGLKESLPNFILGRKLTGWVRQHVPTPSGDQEADEAEEETDKQIHLAYHPMHFLRFGFVHQLSRGRNRRRDHLANHCLEITTQNVCYGSAEDVHSVERLSIWNTDTGNGFNEGTVTLHPLLKLEYVGLGSLSKFEDDPGGCLPQ